MKWKGSGHEEVGLPEIVNTRDGLRQERDVGRAPWDAQQFQTGTLDGMITFSVVAGHTGRHEVIPGIGAAPCTWNDMINGQRRPTAAAVLTTMPIASNNVFPRQHDSLVWNAFVLVESDDAGERIGAADAADFPPGILHDKLSLVEIQKNNSFLNVADGERFIALVQDKDTTA
jgi:hypothetical protein